VTDKYFGSFDDFEDMMRTYHVDPKELKLKDKNILLACYDTPPYEGYAFVLLKRGKKLYEVHGSHCSCDGLEGQWQEEETSWEAIDMRVKVGRKGKPKFDVYGVSQEAINYLMGLLSENIKKEKKNAV
jgi:hypothetical protein